jgi:hypothetical protein
MSNLVRDDNGQTAQVVTPGYAQEVAVTVASTQSNPVGSSTTIVRLAATVDCRIAFGPPGTNVPSSGLLLPAGVVEYFGVRPGSVVAVVQQSGPGVLSVVDVK